MLSSVSPSAAGVGQRERRVFSHSSLASLVLALILAPVFVLIFPLYSHAQELARRIILKDGSYQSVTKYEVKGDRVRYMSAERNEWEEIPASLVDWPATEKYEKERAAGAALPGVVELDKEVANEREFEPAKLPEVAPGLRLPQDSGVYLLDNYKGEPQLVEVPQSAGDLSQSGKVSIFRGAMNRAGSVKENIELEGDHAHVQSHVDVPSFYIKIEDSPAQPDQLDSPKNDSPKKSDAAHKPGPAAASPAPAKPQAPEQAQQAASASAPPDPYRIVRVQEKGGRRILGGVKRAVTGKVSQEQTFVKTTITRVRGGWVKITPNENLLPGEYAVVEMVGKEGMNLYVWDFGVNPKAAANANPWKPEPKANTKSAQPVAGDPEDSSKDDSTKDDSPKKDPPKADDPPK